MGDLTTVSKFKSYAGITSSTWDAMLAELVTYVSADVEGACERTFASASYTEYYDGKWQRSLSLKNYPIISITSINDDTGRTFASSSDITSTDYTFDADNGIVSFIYYRPSRGTKSLKVVYTAGYTTIPKDLELLVLRRIGSIFNRRKSDGSASESLGNYSTSYITEWTAEEKAILARYRRWEASN